MKNVNRSKPARGRTPTVKPGYGVYFRDTTIRLDVDTFKEIQDIASKRQKSFGAIIRELVEVGLEESKKP